MFCKVMGAAIHGIEAHRIWVEVDINDGLPGYEMVGYLSSEVKEAKERVRVALHNQGFCLQPKKVTINLSPADVRKEGTAFDLPIAIAILAASGYLSEEEIKNVMFCGELGLDGSIKPIGGVLPIGLFAKENGIRILVVPKENVEETVPLGLMPVFAASNLTEVCEYLHNPEKQTVKQAVLQQKEEESLPDFSDIYGQEAAKRAIEIAVAGGHNLLLMGSPGAGKTMLASRIPSILPELTKEEQLELSKIYSVSGRLKGKGGLLKHPPFRAPHHTITPIAMAGGGVHPVPGEISLANGGILFLDEFPEFNRQSIELLRQPLEERKITINRVAGSCDYPASFLLVAAMNPCPCGAYPNRNLCHCTEGQIRKYQGKISRPILDRIDLFMSIAPVGYDELVGTGQGECSEKIRNRVMKARAIQKQRYSECKINLNAELGSTLLKQFCPLGKEEQEFMKEAFSYFSLSARGYHCLIKVARTIADLAGDERIQVTHLKEAAGYRNRIQYEC